MKVVALFSLVAVIVGASFAPAYARSTQTIDNGGVYIGTDVLVQPDQMIRGDVTVIGGDATIDGVVEGDVTTVGGTITQGPGSQITGRAKEVGGNFAGMLPWAPSTAAFERENAKMMLLLTYSVVVFLMFLIFPVRVRTALDRLEHHPGLSAGVGTLAWIASIPIAILLFISFIGWPLIPVEFVAYIACAMIGQAALGMLIGKRIFELVSPNATPSPLGAILIGLIVLCAAELLPGIGFLVVALVWLVGLGAGILAFVRDSTFAHHAPVQAAAPAGGPPMTTA